MQRTNDDKKSEENRTTLYRFLRQNSRSIPEIKRAFYLASTAIILTCGYVFDSYEARTRFRHSEPNLTVPEAMVLVLGSAAIGAFVYGFKNAAVVYEKFKERPKEGPKKQ